uniref:Uncharacterized protein n=1 Tax=Amphimedon queenslandica TaxID=400682 RepID=A0A1X7TZK7_AMPQE
MVHTGYGTSGLVRANDELMLVGMVDTGGLVGTGGMRAGECCSVYLGFKPRHITTEQIAYDSMTFIRRS